MFRWVTRRRRGIVGVGLAALALPALPASNADPAQHAGRADEPGNRRIVFPVEGGAGYGNDWHNPRSGGRVHLGNDLFSGKGTRLLSVVDGRVSFVRVQDEGNAGRMLTIKDDAGWQYRYIHLNNDTPGTDDGAAGPEFTLAPGIESGVRVARGQHVAFLGDSGNAEGTAPHLHFEVLTPDGEQINPYASLRLSQGHAVANLCRFDDNPPGAPSPKAGRGYLALDAAGGVFAFGEAGYFGSIPGLRNAGVPIGPATPIALASTPDGLGYWILDDKGGVFTFGTAQFFGSIPDLRAQGVTVGPMKPVALEAAPDGKGYWILDDQGGVFGFGTARFAGSLPELRAQGIAIPNRIGVAGMAAAAGGYWIFDDKGGVFTFGDAGYHGSVPAAGLCKWADMVAAVPTATGKGYWLLAEDGRLWAFGDARYLGGLDTPAIGHARLLDLAEVPPA